MNAFRPPENLVAVYHDSDSSIASVSSFSFRFRPVPVVKRNVLGCQQSLVYQARILLTDR